jgi:hypothetical protein
MTRYLYKVGNIARFSEEPRHLHNNSISSTTTTISSAILRPDSDQPISLREPQSAILSLDNGIYSQH